MIFTKQHGASDQKHSENFLLLYSKVQHQVKSAVKNIFSHIKSILEWSI